MIWLIGEAVPSSHRLMAGVLLSLGWYVGLGPAYSLSAALAVGLQSMWLLRRWGLADTPAPGLAGWGWRRL